MITPLNFESDPAFGNQALHSGPVRDFKVRSLGEDGTQEVLIIYSDCVIARIDGITIADIMEVIN